MILLIFDFFFDIIKCLLFYILKYLLKFWSCVCFVLFLKFLVNNIFFVVKLIFFGFKDLINN